MAVRFTELPEKKVFSGAKITKIRDFTRGRSRSNFNVCDLACFITPAQYVLLSMSFLLINRKCNNFSRHLSVY